MGELRLFRVFLRLSGTKKISKMDQIFILFFKSYMTLLYLLVKDFPNFDPLTATSWAKMSKFIPLGLILSGIDYNLV
jgi:hypothetical protein